MPTAIIPFSRSYDSQTKHCFLSPTAFSEYAAEALTLAELVYNNQTTNSFKADAWIRVVDGDRVIERWEVGPIPCTGGLIYSAARNASTDSVNLDEKIIERLNELVKNRFETDHSLALARAVALLSGLDDAQSIGCKLGLELPLDLLAKLPSSNLTAEEISINRKRKRLPDSKFQSQYRQ